MEEVRVGREEVAKSEFSLRERTKAIIRTIAEIFMGGLRATALLGFGAVVGALLGKETIVPGAILGFLAGIAIEVGEAQIKSHGAGHGWMLLMRAGVGGLLGAVLGGILGRNGFLWPGIGIGLVLGAIAGLLVRAFQRANRRQQAARAVMGMGSVLTKGIIGAASGIVAGLFAIGNGLIIVHSTGNFTLPASGSIQDIATYMLKTGLAQIWQQFAGILFYGGLIGGILGMAAGLAIELAAPARERRRSARAYAR